MIESRSQLTELVPGAYVDEEGVLHLDLPEMCTANGFAPTAENQRMLEQAARDLLGGVATFTEEEIATEATVPTRGGTQAGTV